MAGDVAAAANEYDRCRERSGPFLRPDDVPVSVRGGAACRQPFRVRRERHIWTIPEAPGAQRLRAARLRRVRDSLRELRPEGREAPDGADPAEHRELQASA